ncbi:hypothetical protein MP228_013065 [Amoeboaphelidium protococcarum]|nr:hypothetical protein MP228_013065 [Amoeboaphelidium protococcarum]
MVATYTSQASLAASTSSPSGSNVAQSTLVISQLVSSDVSELFSNSATLTTTSISFSRISDVGSVSLSSVGSDSQSVTGQRSQSTQLAFSVVSFSGFQTSTVSGGSSISDRSPENQALVSSPVFLQYVTVAGAVIVIVGVLGGLYKLRQNRRKQQQSMWQSGKSLQTSQSVMLNRTIPLEITANTSSNVYQ